MIETIEFQINFTATYHNQLPGVVITVDDDIKFMGIINDTKLSVKFTHTLNFSSLHNLQIQRRFTEPDQMLVIESITIDGINIKNIIWEHSYFEPEYPEPWATQQQAQCRILEAKVIGETYLGHNGVWTLNFSSPFYKFIMAAMNRDL